MNTRQDRLGLLSIIYPDLTESEIERVDTLASGLQIDGERSPNVTLRIEYVIDRSLADKIYEDALAADIVESNFAIEDLVYLELKPSASIAPPVGE